MAFLDENGLRYLWLKITALLAGYVEADGDKVLSDNNFTDALLTKLNGIATGATKNTVENVLTSTSTTNALSAAQGKALKDLLDGILGDMAELGEGDMLKSVYDTDGDGIVDNAEKVNGLTVLTAVPANAKFTDNDTKNTAGSTDSSKKLFLVGAESQAANPQTYSHDTAYIGTDGCLYSNGKKVIETSTQRDYTLDITDTLDGSYKITLKDMNGDGSGSEAELPLATTSLAGLMTATMVTKLNGIATGATKTTVDSAISGTSTNPVQNKVIAAELDAIMSDMSSNYAKKTDITGVYKYKGSVATTSALPTTGNTTGDVYNVEERGINYAWNGTAWDNLGELFTVPIIANGTIDTIVAS